MVMERADSRRCSGHRIPRDPDEKGAEGRRRRESRGVSSGPLLKCSFRASSSHQLLHHAVDIVVRNGWREVSWRSDFTALHLAAKMGCHHTVKLLLELGAETALDLRDSLGRTPADYALARGEVDLELLRLLEPEHFEADLTAFRYVPPTRQPQTQTDRPRHPEAGGPQRQAPRLPTLLSQQVSDGKKWESTRDDKPMGFYAASGDPAAAVHSTQAVGDQDVAARFDDLS